MAHNQGSSPDKLFETLTAYQHTAALKAAIELDIHRDRQWTEYRHVIGQRFPGPSAPTNILYGDCCGKGIAHAEDFG